MKLFNKLKKKMSTPLSILFEWSVSDDDVEEVDSVTNMTCLTIESQIMNYVHSSIALPMCDY